jgi:ATP-dependent RNA helicase DeaD
LAPTRELAIQVATEFEKIGGRRIRVALIYGGASINAQIDRLRRGVHIAVGTPGRIIDHMDRGTLRLNKTETVVLDEASTKQKRSYSMKPTACLTWDSSRIWGRY